MYTEQTAYQVGDIVCLKADPERQGPLISVLPPVSGQPRYQVFHGPG